MTTTVDRIVLDTDVVSGMLKGKLTGSLAGGLRGKTPSISFVTAGELLRGAVHAAWGERRMRALGTWLDGVEMIPADAAVARSWGEVTGSALRSGRPLPSNDAWIAACCLVHGLPLATYNAKDFERIDALELVTAGR